MSAAQRRYAGDAGDCGSRSAAAPSVTLVPDHEPVRRARMMSRERWRHSCAALALSDVGRIDPDSSRPIAMSAIHVGCAGTYGHHSLWRNLDGRACAQVIGWRNGEEIGEMVSVCAGAAILRA